MSERLQILSSGGGTQSACMCALVYSGQLPKPDLVAIADTGIEMTSTWAYWDSVIVPKMSSVGVECVRLNKDEWAYKHNGPWNNKGTLLMPVFTTFNEDGKRGKLANFCSSYWKIDVVDNYVRKRFGIQRSGYVKWLGFSVNEARRARRLMAGKEFADGLIRLPLIHEVTHSRSSAIQFVESLGWGTPPRSRCFACPNQGDTEWGEVKADPEMWDLAVKLDYRLREKDPTVYLHKSCVPLDKVEFGNSEDGDRCDSGACFL